MRCFSTLRPACGGKFRRRISCSSATVRGGRFWNNWRPQLGLTDAVHFLGTRPDVPELLSLIDVVLLTSHIEANPVSILEALAVGKPVVATRVGSIAQSVLDREMGYLVEPGDASAMAGHVVELFRQPKLAAALGAAGRQHVVANWSLDRMVEGYEDLLCDLYRLKTAKNPR